MPGQNLLLKYSKANEEFYSENFSDKGISINLADQKNQETVQFMRTCKLYKIMHYHGFRGFVIFEHVLRVALYPSA